MSQNLEKRYRDFLTRIGITTYHDTRWHEIESHYRERHRHYHTLKHLEQLFDLFDETKSMLDKPDEVEAAIWYHDIIYRTQATVAEKTVIQNELESAVFATERLKGSNLNLNNVFSMIVMTGNHQNPKTSDERFFHDLDLSILGSNVDDYHDYSEAIRQEYSFVPEDIYARERIKILDSILAKPTTYQTQYFATRFDEQSVENIRDEIAYLERIQRKHQKRLTYQPS